MSSAAKIDVINYYKAHRGIAYNPVLLCAHPSLFSVTVRNYSDHGGIITAGVSCYAGKSAVLQPSLCLCASTDTKPRNVCPQPELLRNSMSA
jgi:hypothetical protein